MRKLRNAPSSTQRQCGREVKDSVVRRLQQQQQWPRPLCVVNDNRKAKMIKRDTQRKKPLHLDGECMSLCGDPVRVHSKLNSTRGTARIEQWIRGYTQPQTQKYSDSVFSAFFGHFHSYFCCCCCFLFFIFSYSCCLCCLLSSSMAKCTRFYTATSFVRPPLFYDCVL